MEPERPIIQDPLAAVQQVATATLPAPGEEWIKVENTPDDGRPKLFGYWLCTDYFCPHCGKQPVHIESGGGDVYTGPIHWCCSCITRFYLP